MDKTKPALKIFLTVTGFVSFAAALIFAFLNSAPVSLQEENSTLNSAPTLFINTLSDLSAKYPSDVTPPDWVFAILWPLIFLWNLIGVLYMLASLCIKKDNSPILRDPALIPFTTLIFWSCLWLFCVGWLFAYDREIMGLSTFFIMAAALSGYLCLAFSYKSFYQDILILEEHYTKMLWLVRILFHNGFAIVTTWLTCAWKLNFQTVITYADNRYLQAVPAPFLGSLTSEDAGTVVLSILLFEIVLWFILENFVFEKYCRYTLTIFPTLIFALTGIFVGNYKEMTDGPIVYSRNTVITLCALILVCIAFVARIVLVAIRHRRRTRFA